MVLDMILRLLRKREGYSQRGLARMMGVSQASVVRWEQRRIQPRPDQINMLAEIFRVDVAGLRAAFPTEDRRKTFVGDARKWGGKRQIFGRKADAETYVEESREVYMRGAPGVIDPEKSPTFADAAQNYLMEQKLRMEREDIGPSQYQSRQRDVQVIAELDVDGLPIADQRVGLIGVPRAKQVRNLIYKRYRSPRTSHKTFNTFTHLYDYLVEMEVVESNPADKLQKRIRAGGRKPLRISTELIHSIIKHTEQKYRLPVTFAAYTGLRCGEQRALRWEDVDLERSVVSVTRAIKHGGKSGEPKTECGIRKVVLVPQLVELLRQWQLEQPLKQRKNNLVFPTSEGATADGNNWRKRGLYPACDRAGVPRVRWHDLRHYLASVLLFEAENVSRAAIAKMLGHHDANFTYTQYGHWMENAERDKGLATRLGVALRRRS